MKKKKYERLYLAATKENEENRKKIFSKPAGERHFENKAFLKMVSSILKELKKL
jgi:hypothetical protein